MKTKGWIIVVFIVLTCVECGQAYTREEVRQRGYLHCGVSTGSPGFSSVDVSGKWTGFDVDICRAVAAATLGDADKVQYFPLAENDSFTALLDGKVDILSRHTTWTYTLDTALGVHFAGVSYYDGQGVLVATGSKIERLRDLERAEICSPVDSPFEQNLIDYLTRNKIAFKRVAYETLDLAVKGFEDNGCDMISLQQSQLYGLRLGLTHPEIAVVLPEVISKDPLGPVVRQGDDTWFNIVRWSLFAMIIGEELGVSSENIEEMKISNRLEVRRLFGLAGSGGKGLGLADDWAAQIIRQVGNYGEVFARNLGPESAMNIDRGLNKIWSNGGLQYAPPLR